MQVRGFLKRVKGDSHFVSSDCLKRLCDNSEVCRQIVPDTRSSCTEGSVAEVGPHPTDEKRTSLSQAHSSCASVAVVSPFAGTPDIACMVD